MSDDADYEGALADVDAVKRWLRQRRNAAGITQDELATFMGATERVVLNAEKEGDPKAGLPRGYPFFRMLQRLGVVVPEAPVPAGPTVHDRLAALEAEVRESVKLTRSALELLEALAAQPGDADGGAPRRGKKTGSDG